MASVGYKVGDVMDEADQQLPALDLDKVFHSILVLGGMLEDDTLDKAQATLWSIKTSMPIVKEITERCPVLIDTAIDALQEAAHRRGRDPIINGVIVQHADGHIICTCRETNNDGTCVRCYPPDGLTLDQVDDVDDDE